MFIPNTKKGDLLGVCSCNYHGVELRDIRVMRGDKKLWLAFPSIPRRDKSGNYTMENGKRVFDDIFYPSCKEARLNLEELVNDQVCEYIGAPIIRKQEHPVLQEDTAWFRPYRQGELLGFATVRYHGLVIRNIRLFQMGSKKTRLLFPSVNGKPVCIPSQKAGEEIFDLIKNKMG